MSRYRIMKLEAQAALQPDADVEKFCDRMLAWSIARLFGLGDHDPLGNYEPQRPGETCDSYEARSLGVGIDEWIAFCEAMGEDSDVVKSRDDLRRIDAATGDEAELTAVISEISARLKREIEAG